ncbi:IclR family transcriptional regulator [Conexibacter woesei]|uniref:Transcriptional regulator, IclR family n=1 Tax=Conexibacter woesei (strain DSM 14684 / CCUG 47730 / CIP 108061 / JCM 11494 / NBRC 100937 / ID131577) TaxID=469383 RepID=D3F8D7_CONWI|nr:IclR family transcriptional regulator C-terminal domain-containing protein [Conexibacter woesei]ADB49007.1 transcriptional regulator, IclR family [Conexibacter woesei DSM 14684]
MTSPPGASEGAPEPRPRVQSAARAVAILMAVAQSDNGLTTRAIAERVAIGRQAAYHLLHTLVGAGVLVRGEGGRYMLGLRVGTLAHGFARQLAPSEHLAPIVRALAQATGETAYAAGWWSGEIATLTVARGTNPVQAAEVSQGYVGNAHARASGKLLLAFAAPAAREAYLEQHPLVRLAPRTLTTRSTLDADLAHIRERGYAIDDEEFAAGLCCMAVPFDGGHSPFVLALSAPRERAVAKRESYLETMRAIARS